MILQEFIEFDQSVDQIDGITVAQSKLVIEEAAAMHAHWWEHSGLSENDMASKIERHEKEN
ncbi:MAG: hypothetical protein Ct9H90mP5_04320 [Acidimicrobiaceae bacterium]|nr:MAG: hypothetical protein Ct9H90mP5_04320 [Acidimicrobiaceae bacterium]